MIPVKLDGGGTAYLHPHHIVMMSVTSTHLIGQPDSEWFVQITPSTGYGHITLEGHDTEAAAQLEIERLARMVGKAVIGA